MSDSSSAKLLSRVRSLLERGERISTDDCRQLFDVKDLLALARLARIPRERRYGRQAFYRPARVVEYRGEDPELFLSEAETTASEGTSELIIRCRLRDGERLAAWIERLLGFSRGAFAATLHVPPRMILGLSEREGSSLESVIDALATAGSIFITGAEAEVFDAELRARLAPYAIPAERWLAVHAAAHKLGLKTGAGMSYGTADVPAAYAAHLETLRGMQEKTGGFIQFVPTAIHNRDVREFYLAAPTAAQSLRTIAIARMFLDNIQHIGAAPSLVTPEVAFVGLSHGADVIDASVVAEDVLAQERAAMVTLSELPVLDETSAHLMSVGLPVGQVRSRIAEARWTPVPVDARLATAGESTTSHHLTR